VALARSKLTTRGRISVSVEIRRRLGLGPGSVLDWDEEGEKIVVRRGGVYTSEDVHRAVFARKPKRRTTRELKEGIRKHAKSRAVRG
jgi:bifunctional DNA-binding transcriptional regulator/antitoxin component of YhaV-PrlF toxin-antitoxin module